MVLSGLYAEVHSESCQTFKIQLFPKINQNLSIKETIGITKQCSHRASSQTGLFCFKIMLQGVRIYCNKPKSMSKDRRWEKKELKTVYQRISCLYDHLEATGRRVFAYRKEPTNEMDRITVARAPTHSYCQEEVVGQVQQKFSSLQLQNPSTKEGDRN